MPGVFSHDVVLTNQNNRLLRQVEVTVIVYFEAKEETLQRTWAYWNHEERQTINVPASGRIQRVAITGTAAAGAEREPCNLTAIGCSNTTSPMKGLAAVLEPAEAPLHHPNN